MNYAGTDFSQNQPRFEPMPIATWTGISIHRNNNDSSSGDIRPIGKYPLTGAGQKLYGWNAGAIYTTGDGQHWTKVTTSTLANLNNAWLMQNGNILALTLSGTVATIKISTDGGATFSDVTMTDPPSGPVSPFVLGVANSTAALLHDDSVTVAANGTVMMGEYHLAPSYVCRLFRSVDHGVTWTRVFTPPTPPAPSVNYHWHKVRKQESLGGTGIWHGVMGDGRNRSTFASEDDGVTWTQVSNFGDLHYQPVGLLDYGDDTRLIYGSDTEDYVGRVTLDEDGAVESIDVGFDGDLLTRTYYWPLLQDSAGTLYSVGTDYNSPDGTRQTPIIASKDGKHWIVVARFTDGSAYSKRLVAEFNGRIYGQVILAGGAIAGFSFARVDLRETQGLRLDPPATNGLSTDNTTDFEVGTTGGGRISVASGTGTISPTTSLSWHGSQSARVSGTAPSGVVWTHDQSVCTLWTGPAAAVAGNTYYGQFRVRASKPGVFGSAIWFSSGRGPSGQVVGGLGSGGTNYHPFPVPNGDWFQVNIPPYTADAQDDGNMHLFIACYHIGGQEFEIFLDGIGITNAPGEWHPAGTTREAEIVRDVVRTPSSWTHTLVLSMQAISIYLQGSNPYYIGTYFADANNYAEVYFDPTDDTFALRSTAAGVTGSAVKTAARYFLRHTQVVMGVSSSESELKLTVADGSDPLTVTDAACPGLNSALVAWRSGGIGTGQQIPARVAESRWYEGVLDPSRIPSLALVDA